MIAMTASTEDLLARWHELHSVERIANLPRPPEEEAEAEAIDKELRQRNEVPCRWCNAASPFGMCEKCSAGMARDRS